MNEMKPNAHYSPKPLVIKLREINSNGVLVVSSIPKLSADLNKR